MKKRHDKWSAEVDQEYSEMVWSVFKSICPKWEGIRYLVPTRQGIVTIELVDMLNVVSKSAKKVYKKHKQNERKTFTKRQR